MATPKGLGRGFDVLVPNTLVIQDVVNRPEDKIQHLALDAVRPRKDQPRKDFDKKALDELTISVRQHGVMQPIIVVHDEQNMYSIVAGERRWRAATAAGLTEIPAIIRTYAELELLQLSLVENLQRADLSPLEVAYSIRKLRDQFGQSYEQIAQSLGRAYVTVINTQRLLKLPSHIRDALQQNKISEGHARALLALEKKPDLQDALFTTILKEHLNVRQAENLAAKMKHAPVSDTTKQVPTPTPESNRLEKLATELGVRASVRSTKRGGSITIAYSDQQKLDLILSRLGF